MVVAVQAVKKRGVRAAAAAEFERAIDRMLHRIEKTRNRVAYNIGVGWVCWSPGAFEGRKWCVVNIAGIYIKRRFGQRLGWRVPVRTMAMSRPRDLAKLAIGANIEMQKRLAARQKKARLWVSKKPEKLE